MVDPVAVAAGLGFPPHYCLYPMLEFGFCQWGLLFGCANVFGRARRGKPGGGGDWAGIAGSRSGTCPAAGDVELNLMFPPCRWAWHTTGGILQFVKYRIWE